MSLEKYASSLPFAVVTLSNFLSASISGVIFTPSGSVELYSEGSSASSK